MRTIAVRTLHAKTFSPPGRFTPLPLFIPPAYCPEAFLDQLSDISSLLTRHPAAAADAIISLLETLLDGLNVPHVEQRQGKSPRAIKLHDRFEMHKNMPGCHYDGVMALKMIGNAGSHGGTPIEQQHLEDACLVLEQLVTQLYQSKTDLSFWMKWLHQAFS